MTIVLQQNILRKQAFEFSTLIDLSELNVSVKMSRDTVVWKSRPCVMQKTHFSDARLEYQLSRGFQLIYAIILIEVNETKGKLKR